MGQNNNMIIEFDPETRILHLSARERIDIREECELNGLCSQVNDLIENLVDSDRIYLIVDLGKLIIDPGLAHQYGVKISKIFEKYIYPNGLVRYGMQITRITIKVGQAESMKSIPLPFKTKDEAFNYIRNLIKQKEKVV